MKVFNGVAELPNYDNRYYCRVKHLYNNSVPEMTAIGFPSEDDFFEDGPEFVAAVMKLCCCIRSLNERKLSKFPSKTTAFIERELPGIWKTICSMESVDRVLIKEIQELGSQLCLLATNTELNAKVLRLLALSFDQPMKVPETCEINELSPQEVEEAQHLQGDMILRAGRPEAKQLIGNLIIEIITSGIFIKGP